MDRMNPKEYHALQRVRQRLEKRATAHIDADTFAGVRYFRALADAVEALLRLEEEETLRAQALDWYKHSA